MIKIRSNLNLLRWKQSDYIILHNELTYICKYMRKTIRINIRGALRLRYSHEQHEASRSHPVRTQQAQVCEVCEFWRCTVRTGQAQKAQREAFYPLEFCHRLAWAQKERTLPTNTPRRIMLVDSKQNALHLPRSNWQRWLVIPLRAHYMGHISIYSLSLACFEIHTIVSLGRAFSLNRSSSPDVLVLRTAV